MQWVSCHQGKLHVQTADELAGSNLKLSHLTETITDRLAWQSVHELLFDSATGQVPPTFPALAFARQVLQVQPDHQARKVIWCDPTMVLYPPAVAAVGISLDQLCIVRPPPKAVIWTITECLRCSNVGIVIAPLPTDLSRLDARRLQLAAEHGGGMGLMLRPKNRAGRSEIYAAATRWLISSLPGDRITQRWNIELIHGHGGHLSFVLESRRVFNSEIKFVDPLPVSTELADRPADPPATVATA